MLRLPTRDARSQPTTRRETWLSKALNPASLLPGIIIGFLVGLWVEIPKGGFSRGSSREDPDQPERQRKGSVGGRNQGRQGSTTLTNAAAASDEGGELKMVFVVRQDLKMGGGKIASQCAHAAVGIYNELLTKQRVLLRRWEDCGQPKIVVTCKSQQEMNELRNKADRVGLPTYTVADAGRTQVAAGSKTVLVIGPGAKASVDSITRQLRLLVMADLKSLKIKTGICKRVMKEMQSYEAEAEREFAKVENMKKNHADPSDIKQQEHVLEESYMMIPNCRKRLESALTTLKSAVNKCEAETTAEESEELLVATDLVAQVQPLFAE